MKIDELIKKLKDEVNNVSVEDIISTVIENKDDIVFTIDNLPDYLKNTLMIISSIEGNYFRIFKLVPLVSSDSVFDPRNGLYKEYDQYDFSKLIEDGDIKILKHMKDLPNTFRFKHKITNNLYVANKFNDQYIITLSDTVISMSINEIQYFVDSGMYIIQNSKKE